MTTTDAKTPGKFIVLEGCRNAGKTEQLFKIAAGLRTQGIDLAVISDLYDGNMQQPARELVGFSANTLIDPQVELLLSIAGRRLNIDNVVKPTLDSGCWVLADGWVEGDFAKYVIGRDVPPDLFFVLAGEMAGNPAPDLVLLLDVPDEVSLQRDPAVDQVELMAYNHQIRMFVDMPKHVLVDCNVPSDKCTYVVIDAINTFFDIKVVKS